MTTTELIKILKDNECGGVSHKPREISLFINGKYMPNPQIQLSSTGDGICGAEIDLDIDGDFMEEQEQKTGHWIVREDNTSFVRQFPRRWVECSHCGWSFSYDRIKDDYCSKCGAKMESEVSE